MTTLVKNNDIVLAVYLFVRKTKGLDLKHNQIAFYELEKIFVFCFTSYHRKLNNFLIWSCIILRWSAFIPNDLSVNDWRVKMISKALLSSLSFSLSRVKLCFLILFNALLDKFCVALKKV